MDTNENSMNKTYEIHPTRVEKRTLYTTYGVKLELHPQNGMSAEECCNKAILYVISWVKEKIAEDIPSELAGYPGVDGYRDWSFQKTDSININIPVELRTFYWDKTWAMRFVESQEDFPGDFISDISIGCTDDTVLMSIRTECRQKDGAKRARAYRPAYISDIAKDKDIVITEQGIPDKFRISYDPICVNGKSNGELDELFNGFINNPDRIMEVVFYPEPENEEDKALLKRLTETLMGYFYVVIIEGSVRKFFCNFMDFPPYMNDLEERKAVIHRCMFEPEKEGDKRLASIGGIFEVNESIEEELQKVKRTEPLKRSYDFSGVRFINELRNEYSEDRINKARESGSDQELINALEESNQGLKDQVQQLVSELDETKAEANNLRKDNKKKEEALLEEERQRRKIEKELGNTVDGSERESKQAEENIGLLEKKLKIYEDIAVLADGYVRQMIDSLSVFEGADDASKYINWVEHFYKDTIILHERAKKSIIDDKTPNRDWKFICMATHYIAGFTDAMNKGANPEEANNRAAMLYDPGKNGYQATRAVSNATKDRYMKDYEIDISKYHDGLDDETKAILEYHIADHQEYYNMFRIYFCYDKKLKKSIIGYMPGHLHTASHDG